MYHICTYIISIYLTIIPMMPPAHLRPPQNPPGNALEDAPGAMINHHGSPIWIDDLYLP